jgi:hypothetical protein
MGKVSDFKVVTTKIRWFTDFCISMWTENQKNSKKTTATHDDDEHMLGIIVSLFFNLESDSQLRLRLLTKFVEENYEKVDRLVEIREGFRERVQHFVANSPYLEVSPSQWFFL